MNTRKALIIAMVLVVGGTASILLSPLRTRTAQAQINDPKDAEDPFADMIEEGDGLLAQRKAEAVAASRRYTKA